MTTGNLPSLIRKQARPAIIIFLLLTLVVGIAYPLFVTGIAQLVFPQQANGNLIEHNGRIAGSALVGQPFTSPGYFRGRPSATSPVPYNAGASSGSNLAPDNPALSDAVKARVSALHAADPANTQAIPVDLVTASGSGLDPDISIAAAEYQVPRIARERNLSEEQVRALVGQQIEPRQFGLFGEPRVNVLSLNLALDDLSAGRITVTPQPLSWSAQLQIYFQTPVFGMRVSDWIQILLFIAIIAFCVVPLGGWMAKVYTGRPNLITPVTDIVEQKFLALGGVDRTVEMDWREFAVAVMVFAVPCILVVFFLQLVQQFLPLNPAGLGAVPWDLSLNTAVSFATNTNWQAYVPEVTVSYFTQMIGLAVQNFLSSAVGMAVLVALILAFSRRSGTTIGNFWVLLTRSVMILLPLCLAIAIVLVSQGVPQTFSGPVTVPLLDPVKDTNGMLVTTQTIPLGPVASQVAIKHLGTNGGGFYNTNSAHPLENPTPFSNFLEMLAILFIPTALCYTFGKMIGSRAQRDRPADGDDHHLPPACRPRDLVRNGREPGIQRTGHRPGSRACTAGREHGGQGSPVRDRPVGILLRDHDRHVLRCGRLDARFLHAACRIRPVVRHAAGGGGLWRRGFGPVRHARLCHHRDVHCRADGGPDPGTLWQEDRAERDEARHDHHPRPDLPDPHLHLPRRDDRRRAGPGSSTRVRTGSPRSCMPTPRHPRTMAAPLPGSRRTASSITSRPRSAMFVGRYLVIVLTLALAGSLVTKKIVPAGEGTLRDHRPLFIIWLVFVILIVGGLSFVPALSLGPVAEFLHMAAGGMIHV